MQKLRCCFAIIAFLSMCLSATAQRSVSGRIIDGETDEALAKTTLQLYRLVNNDTTFVGGALSNDRGDFAFTNVSNGNYLLKISYVGYKSLTRNVSVTARRNASLGNIVMESMEVQLDDAVITANIPKMVMEIFGKYQNQNYA